MKRLTLKQHLILLNHTEPYMYTFHEEDMFRNLHKCWPVAHMQYYISWYIADNDVMHILLFPFQVSTSITAIAL